jgi:putative peptidoglycan lipid II flippase
LTGRAGARAGPPAETAAVPHPTQLRRAAAADGGAHRFGRAAVLIAALTVLARMVGFGRRVVLTHTMRFSGPGTAYPTASQVPNPGYDAVLGVAVTVGGAGVRAVLRQGRPGPAGQ